MNPVCCRVRAEGCLHFNVCMCLQSNCLSGRLCTFVCTSFHVDFAEMLLYWTHWSPLGASEGRRWMEALAFISPKIIDFPLLVAN
jgi:hypothetical protein